MSFHWIDLNFGKVHRREGDTALIFLNLNTSVLLILCHYGKAALGHLATSLKNESQNMVKLGMEL
jgi:hypothetical protein